MMLALHSPPPISAVEHQNFEEPLFYRFAMCVCVFVCVCDLGIPPCPDLKLISFLNVSFFVAVVVVSYIVVHIWLSNFPYLKIPQKIK